ncbi:hypothetical protein DL771_003902 [Monosporascus sp. 5C6A]|nr:hypothetical protein DL771_003902 [Monosporascus sp. 5C6A]
MTEEFDFEKAMGQIQSMINDEKTFSMALRRGLITERNISTPILFPQMRSARHLKLHLCHCIWDREIVSDDVPSWMDEFDRADAVADPGEKVVDPYKFQKAVNAARTSAQEAIKIIANIEKEDAPPIPKEQPPPGPKPPTEKNAAVSAKLAPPPGPSAGAPPSLASVAASAAPARPPAGLQASMHNVNRPPPPPTPLPALDSVFGSMPRNWDEANPELPPAPPVPVHGEAAPTLKLPFRGNRPSQGSSKSAAKAPPSRRGDVTARTNDDDGLWVGRDGNPLPNLPGCKGSDIPLPAGVEPDRIFTAETKDKLSKILGVFLKIVREGPNRNIYKFRIQEHHALEGLPREVRRHLRVRAYAVLADALQKPGVHGQLVPLVDFVTGWFQSRTDEFASDAGRLAEQMAGREMYPSGFKVPSKARPQTAGTAALGSYVKGNANKPSSVAGGAPDARPTKDDLKNALESVWAAHAALFSAIPEGKRSGLAEQFTSLAVTRGSVFTVPGMLQTLEQKVMWPERVQIQLSSKAEEHDLISKLCCYFILEVVGVVPAEERGQINRWIQKQGEEFREAFEGHKAQLARHSSDVSAAMYTTHTVETVSVRAVEASGAGDDDSEKGKESRKENENAEAEAEAQESADAQAGAEVQEDKWVEVKGKGKKPKNGSK